MKTDTNIKKVVKKKIRKPSKKIIRLALADYFVETRITFAEIIPIPLINSSVFKVKNRFYMPYPWDMEECCFQLIFQKKDQMKINAEKGCIDVTFVKHLRSIQHIATKYNIYQSALKTYIANQKALNHICDGIRPKNRILRS